MGVEPKLSFNYYSMPLSMRVYGAGRPCVLTFSTLIQDSAFQPIQSEGLVCLCVCPICHGLKRSSNMPTESHQTDS